MPISRENRARYPANWREISRRIRFERADGRCECDGLCGQDHGGRCPEMNGEPHTVTGSIVVLTVAHLDHQPENNDEAVNLRALCQRCHLAHDRPVHVVNARRTFSRKRIARKHNHELFEEAGA